MTRENVAAILREALSLSEFYVVTPHFSARCPIAIKPRVWQSADGATRECGVACGKVKTVSQAPTGRNVIA